MSFDYILVGDRTAGCTLAARLGEPNDIAVLLERGPVGDTFLSRIPLLSMDYRKERSPTYKSYASPLSIAPETSPLRMITGKLLRRTSKVNANIFHRGVPVEYNAWAEAGRNGGVGRMSGRC